MATSATRTTQPRHVERVPPTVAISQARMLNHIHTYLCQRLDYDHKVCSPLLAKIGLHIENELAELEAPAQAHPDAPR